MKELEKTYLTPQDISDITGVTTYTITNYLDSYKFLQFQLTARPLNKRKFELSKDFLKMLYTFLWYRGQVEGAERLRNYYKKYDLEVLKWEEFVQWKN